MSIEETQAVPEYAEALADKRSCELRVENQLRRIEQLEAQFSRDYRAAVQPEQIDLMQREREALRGEEAKLKAAEEMLRRAQARVYTRARVGLIDEADARIQALNEEFGPAVESALNALIDPLLKLHSAGQGLVRLYRDVRGRNTQGRSGVVVSSTHELNRVEHLQRMVDIHLQRKLGWWRCEGAPAGAPAFGECVQGICDAVRNEFDELLGLHDLDPAEVAAVRAEQRARGEIAGVLALAQPADDDIETFDQLPD